LGWLLTWIFLSLDRRGSFHAGVTELFSAGEVFNYHGGLTVPPCSEIVNWWVLETPITISQQEYDIITDGIKRIKAATGDGENARPTQPLNDREIVSY
jgi:carbonic anhydrase